MLELGEDGATVPVRSMKQVNYYHGTIMMDKQKLTIRNKSEILYLNPDSILFIEADGNYSNVYFTDGGEISALTYQRAEIAKMMREQLPEKIHRRFALLGKSFLVNLDYILRIQPGKQLLTFRVNHFGTTKKKKIRATAKSLTLLAEEMEKQQETDGKQ